MQGPCLQDDLYRRVESDSMFCFAYVCICSIITDLFCGQLQSTVSCSTCGHVSYCFDPFCDLSLPFCDPSAAKPAAKPGAILNLNGYSNTSNGYSSTYASSYGTQNNSNSSSSRYGSVNASAVVTLRDCLQAFAAEETLDGEVSEL